MSASTTLGLSTAFRVEYKENSFCVKAGEGEKNYTDKSLLDRLWIKNPNSFDPFSFSLSGGYYTIELHNRRLRLVALNTNLYLDDVDPDGELHDVDIEASWFWLERTMIEARRKGQNVSNAPPACLRKLFDIQTTYSTVSLPHARAALVINQTDPEPRPVARGPSKQADQMHNQEA